MAGPRITEVSLLPLADHRAYGCRPYLCALGSGLPNQMDSRLPPEEREGAAIRFSRFIENGDCLHEVKTLEKRKI